MNDDERNDLKTGSEGDPSPIAANRKLFIVLLVFYALVAIVIYDSDFQVSSRSRTARAKADLRSIAVAIESYHLDYEAFPPSASGVLSGALTSPVAYLPGLYIDPYKEARYEPTQRERHLSLPVALAAAFVFLAALYFEACLIAGVRVAGSSGRWDRCGYAGLLVASLIYLKPFMSAASSTILPAMVINKEYDDKPHEYDYYSDGKSFYLLRSLGPFGIPDIPDFGRLNFDFSNQEVRDSWVPFIYDATNGTISGGDIFRYGEWDSKRNMSARPTPGDFLN